MSDEPIRYLLTYMDRRGASVFKQVTAAEAGKLLPRLRAPASLFNEDREKVGGVSECDGADDQRIKWNWYIESDLP